MISLLFCLANLALALPLLTLGGGAERFGGPLAALALVICAAKAHRDARFTVTGDAAAVAALTLLSYWLAAPPRALGVLWAFTVLRSLYGGSREVSAASLAAACGFAAATLAAGDRGASLLDAVAPILLLVLTARVVNHSWQSVVRSETRADHDRAVAAAGSRLRDAHRAPSIAVIVWRAARRIAGGDAAVALSVEEGLLFWDANSEGLKAPRTQLPEAVRAALAEGLPFITREFVVRGSALSPRLQRHEVPALVVPVCTPAGVQGLIAVPDPDGELELLETLAALASEASSALEATAAADAAAQRQQEADALLSNSPDLIATIDREGTITYASSALSPMLGYAPARVVGTPFESLLDARDAREWRAALARLSDGGREVLEMRLSRRGGETRQCEIIASGLLHERSVAATMLTVRDVTDRKASEDELVHRAYHDPLTGLPNRRLFLERTREMLSRASRADSLAVLFIDLDGFKAVNDRHSHAAGDALLEQVARGLEASLRPTDTAARLSGDEFAILLGALTEAAEAGRVAQRVLAAVTKPCTIGQETIRIGASMGVAVGGAGAEDAEDLLHRADLAMYAAKRRSGDAIELRLPDDHQRSDVQAQLTVDLPAAIRDRRLQVRYQPILSLADERIVAAEALVRWLHPAWGLLPPRALIPLAEHAGMIREVFDAVLDSACADAARWPASSPVGVSINLSPLQLRQDDLPARVADALAAHDLPAERLIVEVPQRALLESPSAAESMTRQLKRVGVRLAIDGFDTEHPPIPLVRRLSIDFIKLDRTLLTDIDDERAGARALIALAGQLGLPVVATGVERAAQRDALHAMGCAQAQGHLFSRPLPHRAFTDLLWETTGMDSPAAEAEAMAAPPSPAAEIRQPEPV